MNPDLVITVPIRIAQSADDTRVPAETITEIPGVGTIITPGTNKLVEELRATNSRRTPELLYQFYDKDAVKDPDPDPDELGVHFATINHDLPDLTAWLKPLLTR